MSLQFSPTLLNVVSQFQKQGLASNSFYTRDQYFVALDRMCGVQYDRTVAEQLFEQCQVNYKQQCSLEDFCQVMIDADKILKRKIAQTEEQIEQYNTESRECSKQLRDAQQFQNLNSAGVERDSLLSVLIHNAQNIVTKEDFQTSLITITVDKDIHTCNANQGDDKYNPHYDQQFQFNIETGQEDIEIKLYVNTRQNQKLLVGGVQIELGDLHDQNVHEMNLQLKDSRGMMTGTTLSVEVQWMYNKVKYYQELMVKYHESIEQLKMDSEDFKRDLAVVQQPLVGGSINVAQSQQKNLPYQPPTPQNNNIIVAPYQQQQPLVAESQRYQPKPPVNNKQPEESSDELRNGFFCILLMGIFSLMQSFVRPEFLDFIIFMLLFIIIVLDHLNTQFIQVVGVMNIVSILYDFIWFTQFKIEWNPQVQNDPLESEYSVGMFKFTLVFLVMNMILKSGISYFLYHFYKQSMNDDVQTLRLWQFEFTVGRQKHNIFQQAQQGNQEQQYR